MGRCGIDEPLDHFPRFLVGFRCSLAQEMYAPVNVAVIRLIISADRTDNLNRFLGRSRIVEINQRAVVHRLVKDREVLSDFMYRENKHLTKYEVRSTNYE